MRSRSILSLALLTALVAAAPASANYRVGLSEQDAKVFSQPDWQKLKLKRIRYIIPWDWYKHGYQVDEINTYLSAAAAAKQDVLLTFAAKRGCYVNGRYSKSRACRAPSVKAYAASFKRFHKAYPAVKTFATWNETNNVSEPTARNPKLAAQYFLKLRSMCRKCTVMAADVLDKRGVASWLRSFLRASKGKGSIWGIHNYEDVNRLRSSGTRAVLATVPGQVWMTETGGIVSFGRNWPYNPKRAANRTKYMFKLADRYDTRQRGLKSKITRVYVYRWFGEPRTARFDAGLFDVNGKPRPAFKVFRSYVAKRQK